MIFLTEKSRNGGYSRVGLFSVSPWFIGLSRFILDGFRHTPGIHQFYTFCSTLGL